MTVSQTNFGCSATLSRPLANQPEKYFGWSVRGRDLSQTNQELVRDTVATVLLATNHEMTNHERYVSHPPHWFAAG